MTQQSFDDVQIDFISELLGDNPDLLFEKIKTIAKTSKIITTSIDDFFLLEINNNGKNDFIPSSARDKLRYGYYYTVDGLKIKVNEGIEPNHYIAE
jgi:hypothetical protein